MQVLSFDLSWLVPALILVGVAAFMTGPSQSRRHNGRILIGLGLMLHSLGLIVAASASLRESVALQGLLAALAGEPVLALLLAALLTWAAHSSVAVVLLVMSLVATAVVPPVLGFALVLGANVGGSGLIPLALTWTGKPTARRIPLGNLTFRLLGAILALPLVDLAAPLILGLEADLARQVANFHTLFNLLLAALFLPLVRLTARLAARALPDRADADVLAVLRYLDEAAISRPAVALGCATREVLHMADAVETMLGSVMEVFRNDDTKLLDTLSDLDDGVDQPIDLATPSCGRRATARQGSFQCNWFGREARSLVSGSDARPAGSFGLNHAIV